MLHESREGVLTPIASMEDDHLMNTIKFPFKKFDTSIASTNEIDSYLLGKQIKAEKMTPEKFNEVMSRIWAYVIEGLRRDSTREKVFTYLGNFNPVFKESARITFNPEILEVHKEKKILEVGNYQEFIDPEF